MRSGSAVDAAEPLADRLARDVHGEGGIPTLAGEAVVLNLGAQPPGGLSPGAGSVVHPPPATSVGAVESPASPQNSHGLESQCRGEAEQVRLRAFDQIGARLSVLSLREAVAKRVDPAPYAVARLADHDARASLFEIARGRESGQPGAGDEDFRVAQLVGWHCHERRRTAITERTTRPAQRHARGLRIETDRALCPLIR